MTNWNPSLYMKYGYARTRPAWDLAAQIPLDSPGRIADLGCGTGNSTEVLSEKWPGTDVVGIDSSPEMLDAARRKGLDATWLLQDLNTWSPDSKFDLIFSNAAFQWIHPVGVLLETCVRSLNPGGVLAFQVPANANSLYYTSILELAAEPGWAEKCQGIPLLHYHSTRHYYDLLTALPIAVQAWETQYFHIMESPVEILEWISGTGLRPYLQALADDGERETFKALLLEKYRHAYPHSKDGKVLFPFNRQFFVAVKH